MLKHFTDKIVIRRNGTIYKSFDVEMCGGFPAVVCDCVKCQIIPTEAELSVYILGERLITAKRDIYLTNTIRIALKELPDRVRARDDGELAVR